MPTKNKRRAAFRRRLTSEPPPPDEATRAKLEALDQGAAAEWIFTFGFGHEHPITGEPLYNRFVRIAGEENAARAEMQARFGAKWAFNYPSEQAAGVDEYDLVELEQTDEHVSLLKRRQEQIRAERDRLSEAFDKAHDRELANEARIAELDERVGYLERVLRANGIPFDEHFPKKP